jgi:hypothetical protein
MGIDIRIVPRAEIGRSFTIDLGDGVFWFADDLTPEQRRATLVRVRRRLTRLAADLLEVDELEHQLN